MKIIGKTAAIIVSAGMSSRMEDFKPMLKVGSSTLIKTIIKTYQNAGVDDVIVVAGNHGSRLRKHLYDDNITFLYNPNYSTTMMFDSALIGFNYINDQYDKIFFSPVDVGLFSSSSIKDMMDFMDNNNVDILQPICKNVVGHPVLLNSKVVPHILTHDGREGMRGAISTYKGKLLRIELSDFGMTMDIDTKDDYKRLLEYYDDVKNELMIRHDLQVRLYKQDKFFGSGVAQLLLLIDETGSMKLAAERMNMSYCSAWKIINKVESFLDFKLVVRKAGGKNGGCTYLTEKGQDFTCRFLNFQKEINEFSNTIFDKYFLDYNKIYYE